MDLNTFRHIDALEYAAVWESCAGLSIAAIEVKAQVLNERMQDLEASGTSIPTYLLAAYRAYENAILLRLHPDLFNSDESVIVKLNDKGTQ